MAQRDTSNMRTVIQQVGKDPSQLVETVAAIGTKIIEQSQEAKISENASRAQLELNALQNEYQIKFESNPSAGLEDYKQQRQAIFDKYGGEISPFFRRPWNNATRRMNSQNDLEQQAWVIRQSRVNTVNSINASMKNNFLMASQNGQRYGASSDAELTAMADYSNARQQLEEFGNKNLGPETTKEMLNNFNRDYMKSFLSGVVASNPDKANALLQDKNISEMFTANEISNFKDAAAAQTRKNRVRTAQRNALGSSAVLDLVNSIDGNYFDKRLEIDTMEANGDITTRMATQARRVLTSQRAVDAVTSTSEMADIITKVYDLNSIADTNSEDYLTGIQNINEQVATLQASGRLSAEDANKLNSQITTLTAAKLADASQRVGINFNSSRRQFEQQLPPEQRAEAVRQLFYRTQGQELSRAQYDSYASQIINDLKEASRNRAIETASRTAMAPANGGFAAQALLSQTLNPETNKPFTMEDVRETAKANNMTEQQVMDYIRLNNLTRAGR